jgi:hypothetical protein
MGCLSEVTKKKSLKPSVMRSPEPANTGKTTRVGGAELHACNPSAWEAEGGQPRVRARRPRREAGRGEEARVDDFLGRMLIF